MNVADIKAQVAANEKGVQELQRVVALYGWPAVSAYMRHVMDNAEEMVRRVIARIGNGVVRLHHGRRLAVARRCQRRPRDAQRSGGFHRHRTAERGQLQLAASGHARGGAVCVPHTWSATTFPLNDGCLKPLHLVIPPGTFLSPTPGAAVVAGNTEVSQATCNALFGALKPIACSQATMNNFLFGDARRQYYETICGGTGAGPGFDGTSAIHSHMTNTRMTDPEVLELRYPVRLESFAIRRGSGGAGRWRGGDGAIRRVRFLEPMTAVIVASRRNVAPFGLEGGADGAVGRQWVERADGTHEVLTGTDSAELAAGDVFVIETPGGGGYGPPDLTCRSACLLFASQQSAAVASLAVWLVPRWLDWTRYRTTIEALASATLGRPVTIAGPIVLTLLPRAGVDCGPVDVGGSDGSADLSIRVRGAATAVALLAADRGPVDARELVLGGPDLRIPWPQSPASSCAPAGLARGVRRADRGRPAEIGSGFHRHRCDAGHA